MYRRLDILLLFLVDAEILFEGSSRKRERNNLNYLQRSLTQNAKAKAAATLRLVQCGD